MHRFNQYAFCVITGEHNCTMHMCAMDNNTAAQPDTMLVRAWFNRFTFPPPDVRLFMEEMPITFPDIKALHGYDTCDLMEHRFSVWLPAGEEMVFEEMWMFLNDEDRPNGQTERSLSIGDVIEVISPKGMTIRMAADTVGFKPVSDGDWEGTEIMNRYYQEGKA